MHRADVLHLCIVVFEERVEDFLVCFNPRVIWQVATGVLTGTFPIPLREMNLFSGRNDRSIQFEACTISDAYDPDI